MLSNYARVFVHVYASWRKIKVPEKNHCKQWKVNILRNKTSRIFILHFFALILASFRVADGDISAVFIRAQGYFVLPYIKQTFAHFENFYFVP
jgi:hypothetical protein